MRNPNEWKQGEWIVCINCPGSEPRKLHRRREDNSGWRFRDGGGLDDAVALTGKYRWVAISDLVEQSFMLRYLTVKKGSRGS